ncbi:putative BRCT domain-containing protein [Seiridium unicorne]|uniref:BRCT domain-containing protein n=1 Tax=Seiridium unicorne TaxID=138068 RepID=A0ABR2UY41_9PEZI
MAMKSPPPSSDTDALPFDSSKPFAGVVVCCTSIPPEHRTYIAERVEEFGGVHKYDLTPDVTHLIVGEYDTAKYRHVARERPDIKPMAAGWINAVRSHWVNDQDFDFAKLESEYHLRTFESSGGLPQSPVPEERQRQKLLICLTGFEEQDRHYIEEMVVANGGNYMGDLSRKVTHLIVCKPEGKKYQAAKNWNITTVSIEWLDDSVRRGMILDETCYDPILPKEDRGKGAIIRREVKRHSVGGKRQRDNSDIAQQNGPRKLRKSASMRLSSQGNSLLNEILNSKQAPADAPRPALGQKSASVSALPPVSGPAPKLLPVAGAASIPPPPSLEPTQPFGGVFTLCRFMIHGFPEYRHQITLEYLTSHGGRISTSVSDLASHAHIEPQDQRFLVVPQLSQPDTHPIITDGIHIVTEFYIERCIHGRKLCHPNDHVLGRPFPRFPVAGFDELTIHSTGFKDEQLNQVEKTIVQLGAKYAEKFNSQSSLMVCPSLKDVRTGKLDLALRSEIPVVNADWLWQCISTGFRVPWDNFIFAEIRHKVSIDVDPDLDKHRQKLHRTRSEPALKKQSNSEFRTPALKANLDTTAFSEGGVPAPVDDFVLGVSHVEAAPAVIPQEDSAIDVSNYDTAPTHLADGSLDAGPLSELSKNALNKSPETSPSKPGPRKSLRRFPTEGTVGDSEAGDDSDTATVCGPNVPPKRAPADNAVSAAERARKQKVEDEKAAERRAMAKQLTSLMGAPDMDDGNNGHTKPGVHAKPQRRKREILGRALSNASAASSASADSASTSSKQLRINSVQSVTGSIGLLDEMLSGEQGSGEKDEKISQPPATQIGYDDPQATKQRAEVMNRIQGKKKASADPANPDQEKVRKVPMEEVTGTAASRRPRRKGF